jgi:hypothetical protein
VELNEVVVNAFENFQLTHGVQLLINLTPFNVIEPVCWVWLRFNCSTWSSKEESPFIHVYFIVSEQNLGT